MPVQEEVIPYLLGNKNDVIALAQTGTGKTASYGIPVIQKTDASSKQTQAIILSPTRELCLQIADDLNSFAKYIDGLHIAAVYGGTDIGSQIRTLKHGVQIIVATPGRLLDLINRGVAQLENVNNVVLDEADEMLNMGFSESINAIFENVPEDRNTLLFSATMSKDIEKIALNYLHDHKEIVVGSRNEGAEHVNHIYYLVNAKDKYLALKRVVDFYPRIFAIIFCRTKLETQDIADKLIKDGYNAEALHGDLSQQQRDLTMQKFRNHTVQFLVATDVAARGLDVDDLTHVINYGLPDDVASYTHRSGRTGRAGKNGVSISIVHSREKSKIRDIEKRISKQFERKMVPTPQYIIEKQLYNLADRIEKVEVNEDEIAKYLPGILRKLEWLSGEDLLKRIVSMEFNRLLDYYKDAPEVEDYVEKKPCDGKDSKKGSGKAESRRRSDADKDSRKAERGYERIYVNAGKADGFMPARLIETINENMDGRVDIGRIDLLQNYALFDVRKGSSNKVITALKNARFFGKRLYAEVADPKRDYSKASNRKSNSKGKRYDEGDKFAKFKKDKKGRR
jgi:ATP-dependent RNA helicase DeaD